MIHAHHDHSDIKSGTHTCAWVCTRMGNITTCTATSVHTNTTSALPQQGPIVPIQQRTPAHVQVQNLQSLKSAQPCPRIRGYHRNLIAVQDPATKIYVYNHKINNVMHFTCMHAYSYHVYPSNKYTNYVQQYTYN